MPTRRRLVALVLASSLASVGVACSNDVGGNGATGDAAAVLARALQVHADGDLAQAAELYKQVLVLDPENKFAYYNLGLIHQTQGRLDAAAERYLQALEVDPAFVVAIFNLATVRTQQGATDEAVELYRGVLDLNPNHAAAHLNLGFLLLDSGRRKEGKAELRIAVELDPSLASRVPERLLVVGESTGP